LLLFDQGTSTVSVHITIVDDNIVEAAEICQVSLTLVNPLNPNIIIVSPSLANISVLDDDSKSTHLGWNSALNERHKPIFNPVLHSCCHWV